MARTYGLGYKEDEECRVPFATKTAITVPKYKLDFTEEQENEWWHSFFHELFHHTAPEDFKFLDDNKISTDSLVGMLLNAVVDHKIERTNYGNFEGVDEVMDKGRRSMALRIMDNMQPGLPEQNLFGASFVFDDLVREKWSDATRGLDAYADAPDEIREMVDKWLADETLFEDYLSAATPEECWDVALRMVGDQGYDREEEEQKAKGGSGDGDEESEGQEKGSGDPSNGEGDEREEQEESSVKQKIKVMYGDNAIDEHDEKQRRSNTSIEIDYSDYDLTSTPDIRDPVVYDYDKDGTPQLNRGWYSREIGDYHGGSVSNAVKKYLITLKRSRWEGNKKTGRVSKKNTWKKKAFSGTPMSMNVHKKKAEHHEVDTAVTVLVDQSGSMSGTPFENAIKASIALNETFAHIGIPTEILTFTDYGEYQNLSFVIKGFNSKISDEELLTRMDHASERMGANADGESLMWAADRLLQRKEKKKVLIVFSDGQPAACTHGDHVKLLKDTVNNLSSVCDVHGIGIESDAVKHYYPSHDVINDVSQLETALITVLKNKVVSK